VILCFASIAFAEDFKTINGKEYKNAKLSRVEPDGIVITFSGGIVKIPFAEMSPEIQKKYGYDPAAAADFQKQAYEAGVRRSREIAESQAVTQHKQLRTLKHRLIVGRSADLAFQLTKVEAKAITTTRGGPTTAVTIRRPPTGNE
jgi:hypothetical protein